MSLTLILESSLRAAICVDELVVDVGCAMGFFGGGYALAQRIEGDMHALLVDLGADAEGIFDLEARNKARTELASNWGVFGELAEGAIVGECNKGGAKNGHSLTLPAEVLGTRRSGRNN